ncbi:ATP/GTP-binding protein [Acinetobacter towneri]|uniref:GTP-binding protein n=1 Tax=Acinetobacter towneri TaxID=202956 RepID=UPI00109C184F
MILQQYKIVFGGTMGAGKSAAINALSDIPVVSTEAVNTDLDAHSKYLTTVGIDYGEISLEDGTKIGLYGTPGQDRFDFMWTIVCQGAIGTVVLIDHSNPDRLKDLEFYLDAFQKYSTNIVIGVTHIDEQNDQLLKIYYDWMSVNNRHHPLFAVDARQKDDVLLMIETLIASLEVQSVAAEIE